MNGQNLRARSNFLTDDKHTSANPRVSGSADHTTRGTQSEHASPSIPRISEDRLDNIEEEERSGLEIASAALGQPERTGEVPFYTGKPLPSL